MDINSVLIIISRAVNEENLSVAGVICVGRIRIWGSEPPDPPVRSGTPPLKLPCVRFDLWVAECGVHFILEFS